ncbi:GDSL-like Lipase/Acylhydrolase-domain-containing protein [Blastocladiella britannica]|nr:GDSL-like Lipase/Acylhydrolase-domain-containing protein [Blastocladiella britannica]
MSLHAKSTLLCVAALLAVLASAAVQLPKFDSMVVFGDDNSDTGNTFKMTNNTYPPSGTSVLYDNGRFSNGQMWLEYLANFLNPTSPSATLPVLNFAFAGATTNSALVKGYTGTNGNIVAKSVDVQLGIYEQYLKVVPAGRAPATLFVVWAGMNDFLFEPTPAAPTATPAAVASSVLAIVKRIDDIAATYKLPLHHIVVMGMPSLSVFPGLKRFPVAQDMFRSLVLAYEADLLTRLPKQVGSRFGSDVFHADTFVLMRSALENPSQFNIPKPMTQGLTNTDSCIQTDPDTNKLTMCLQPAAHIFWDDWHFATRFHRILARSVSGIYGIQIEPLPMPGADNKEVPSSQGNGTSTIVAPNSGN